MKVTLHLEGEVTQVVDQCLDFVRALGVSDIQSAFGKGKTAAAPAAGKGKRGKGKKEEPAEEVEEAEEDLDLGEDAEEAEEAEEAEDVEADADEEGGEDFDEAEEAEDEDRPNEAELKKLKAALKAHADKKGKAVTVKLLMKFGKTSADVKKKDLPKLLKLLKV